LQPVEGWVEVHAEPLSEKTEGCSGLLLQKPGSSLTDGSFSASEGCGGGGDLVRGHSGSFATGASQIFPSAADLEGAEALACKRALQLENKLGCQKFVLETDSASVVAKLSEESHDLSLH
jgi:ribonuclease HI